MFGNPRHLATGLVRTLVVASSTLAILLVCFAIYQYTQLEHDAPPRATTDGGGYGVLCWHVYGEISASETPDRLLYIDNATALEFKKPKDYGDVARGSAETYAMKLRNNSASLTASTVQLIAEALFQGSGAWYDFDEGSGFTATLSLASSIANGADSPVITVRRITPDAEALGLHEGRLQVSVGSWA